MQMIRYSIVLLLTCCSFLLNAQDKLFSMQDAMVNSRTSLAPESVKQLRFVKDSDQFTYIKKVNNEEVFVLADFKNPDGTTILTLEQLNKNLSDAKLESVKAFPPVQFLKDGYIVTIKGKRHQWKGGVYSTPDDETLATKEVLGASSKGYVVFTENNNLFIKVDGKVQQITSDGSADIVYGKAVHQQEFGITKGIFWNNTGNQFAFYRMDQSMVPEYPIIDWSVRPAKNVPIRYPMAGDSSHHVTLEVCDVTGKRTRILTEGDPEQYLTNICWSPDDKFIFIAVLNRGQNHMKLNQYDASTGKLVKTLFEEQHEKYVEPLHEMLFVKNNPKQFIWQSRKDGWNHLYLYDISGNMIRQLTKGNWEVTDVNGFDAKGEQFYYTSTEESPLTRNLYAVSLKTAKTKRLSEGAMRHLITLNEANTYAIDNASSVNEPRVISLIDLKSGAKKVLYKASNPLKEYKLGEMQQIVLKSKDGYDLHGRLYKPVDFDASKKYPVVVYWYGGPHAQITNGGWNGGSGDLWFQFMAQRGFVVFTMDTRGSAYRGMEFEQTIFRNAGKAQMEDLLVGVDYLKSLGYADASRMGLFGWSYGGFMTTSFLLNHPGVFKVGVAGGPVMDWKYYEIMYTERYMDAPKENPQGYAATNLISRAGELKDKLMLIHGMQDPVVVMQHSVNFVKSAVDKNVQVDYMIYPGHEHNVLGKDRTHLYQKVTDYFLLHLK